MGRINLTSLVVPVESVEFRQTEKGSKFLAWVGCAETEIEAREALAVRGRLHHDATHHCWAFRMGGGSGLLERYSDAGEPSGTAGRPILDAIRGAGLTNVIVIVTRWFGGTKLGRGGLVRAYGGTAAEALKLASRGLIIPMVELTVTCPYEMIGWVERTVKSFGGEVKESNYSERVLIRLKIPDESKGAFRKAVEDDGGGKAAILGSASE